MRRKKQDNNIDYSSTLDVFNKYSIEYNNFSDGMKYIVACMGLEDLHNPVFWNKILFTQDVLLINRLNGSISFYVITYLKY
ncbi:hypothetical protein [Clostridium yunnanense]|uniref:hypothetical protein n=1 Tax=Clostridium yunnanense TaxID=2800325 RepID=UPI001904BE6C|nr:hypothetical protein [Clostridium yunnanense]